MKFTEIFRDNGLKWRPGKGWTLLKLLERHEKYYFIWGDSEEDYETKKRRIMDSLLTQERGIVFENMERFGEKMGLSPLEVKLYDNFRDFAEIRVRSSRAADGRMRPLTVYFQKGVFNNARARAVILMHNNPELVEELYPGFELARVFNPNESNAKAVETILEKLTSILNTINNSNGMHLMNRQLNEFMDEYYQKYKAENKNPVLK